jgi:hypothetical protein
MAFEDLFRMSVHAVIGNEAGVLLLRATYAKRVWGLPGGALEPGESGVTCESSISQASTIIAP